MMNAQSQANCSALVNFACTTYLNGLKASLAAFLRLLAVLFVIGSAVSTEQAEAASLIGNLGGTSGFGSLAMGRNDDGSSAVISLGSGFPHGIKLFSGVYNTLYINNNGNITFRAPLGTYTPIPFPVTNLPMLAPFWGDVDTRGWTADSLKNNVYYSTAVPGKFYVTWNYVGYYSGATNKLNAFQLILTDRSDIAQGDFDIEYRYEQLQWTTGSASGGSNGLGGTPAQMGYDAGDAKNFYRHPDSGSANILKLMETSNVGEPGVWRFEVRGGTPNPVKTPNLVNVRLIETLNATDIDIDPGSFQVAPYSVTSGNGQTVVEWRFATFPANATKDLGFDVVFKNPQAGENRLLVAKLELLYNDVNGNPVRTELGSEYVSVYPSIYQVIPATDKATYGPNEVVQISSTMKNLSAFSGSAAARISIQDAKGFPVALLGMLAPQTVAAGGTGIFSGLNFPTGSTYVGNYKVLAELVDANDRVVAAGTAPFTIRALGGESAKVNITTDKQSYAPLDVVRISDRVANLMTNSTLDDVRVITTVTNPDGSVGFTRTEVLAQLIPSGMKDYSYAVPLASAAAGKYQATLTLAKADGATIVQASTPFTVTSTADSGAGLVGSLTATPSVVNMGQAVNLAFVATNRGNAPLSSVPLKVTIIDPEKQQVIAEFPYAVPLPVGGAYNGTAKWVSSAVTGESFVAVLNAEIGGKVLPMAQATFKVLKLDIQQALTNGGRVLVLVQCNEDENEMTGVEGQLTPCITERSQVIQQTLNTLGVSHTIATNENDFKQAFRSGAYNTYWISGKEDKLHDELAGEIREMLFAGDSLIIDGGHDQRNKVLDETVGVLYRGKLGQTSLVVDIAGAMFESQSLATTGRALVVDLNGGIQQASFNVPRVSVGSPAIVSRRYGAGHALLFAFDLVGSLAQPGWQPLLEKSLASGIFRVPAVFAPGMQLSAKVSVANQGPAASVSVRSTLPRGALLVGSNPTATFDANANTLTWLFDLAREQGKDIYLSMRVPGTPGDYSLQTLVSTISDNVENPYGNPLLVQLPVVGAQQTSANVVSALRALPLVQNTDVKQRDAVIDRLQSAMGAIGQGTASGYELAIKDLIRSIDLLAGIVRADTRAVREGIDRILREVQWRWSQLPR